MPKFKDLTGKRFGRLVVISRDEEMSKKHHRSYWLCLCDCGKKKIIAGLSLSNGATKSCGCLRNEKVFNAVAKNEVGKKYGKLTVLEMAPQRDNHGRIQWVCQCDCGTIKTVPGDRLRSGNTQSCDCLSGVSKGEQKIINILDDAKITYVKEYKPSELNGKRFDFAIIENNIITRLIEFDGEQHFKQSKWGRDKLEKTQESDTIKNQYAFKHNIPIVRIPYWELNNIDYNMLFSEKFLIKKGE